MTQYYQVGKFKFKIEDSPKKGKDKRATFQDGTVIDFGAKKYPEYPGTKRGDSYCTRSLGIKSKKKSANTLSRKILWKCKGKKSKRTFKEAGVEPLTKEEYFDSI